MGKRATVTQVVHTSKNRDGFIEDAFWGATAPKAIAHLPAAIEAQGRDHLRAALGLAVRHLEGRHVDEEAVEQVGEVLMCGAVSVLVAAVKSAAEEAHILRDLQNLHIDPECAQDIYQVLDRGRQRIKSGVEVRGPQFPHIDDLRWRVDVTISTTSLSRVMRPSILLQLTLSDSCIHTLEVTAEELQDLRYDVARCLKEMQDLESSRLFRLPVSLQAKTTANPHHAPAPGMPLPKTPLPPAAAIPDF